MAWFKAKALGDGRAEIWINKPIGSDWAPDWWSDLTGEEPARQFIDAVEALGDMREICVRLNCPGGDVASGIAIMNYLKKHQAKIHMRVEGQAASIATVILMAGEKRTMGVGATLMVHDPSGWMNGYYTEDQMRDGADTMAKIKAACVQAYQEGTGKSADEISALLSQGDTVLTADEAIEWGLVTDKDDTMQAVACADLSMFKQQMAGAQRLNAVIESQASEIAKLKQEITPVAMGAPDVISQCDAAGFKALAVDMIAAGASQQQVEQRLKMAADIKDICVSAELDYEPIVAKIGDQSAIMRALVLTAKAQQDQDLDNHHPPKQSTARQVNPRAVYNQLNTGVTANAS